MHPSPRGPLDGLRILDLSRMVAGGVCGMLLADFGADVVKVQRPGVGDPLRRWTTAGHDFWWRVYARNKRFVTLNLKSMTPAAPRSGHRGVPQRRTRPLRRGHRRPPLAEYDLSRGPHC